MITNNILSKIRQEIEKRLKNIRDYMTGVGVKYKGPKYYKAQGKESAYDALLSFIYSLQQEQPAKNLEEEVSRYIEDNFTLTDEVLELSEEERLYYMDKSDVLRLANHFYELGKKNK